MPQAHGIVAAGDRMAVARRLRPIAMYPPREVPSGVVWAGALRNLPMLPVTVALAVMGIMTGALLATGAAAEIPVALPVVLLVAAFASFLVALGGMRRARRLLESGMPAQATVTRVHVNLLVHSGGRSHTTIEYDWTFAGQTRHGKARGYTGRRERALVNGQSLDLLCDPSSPEDHLVPLFYGIRLEQS